MNGVPDEEPPPPWPEQWAIQVAVRAGTIEHKMRLAIAGAQLSARQEAAVDAIRDFVQAARDAARQRRSGRRWQSRGVRDWWRGTSVERAHQSLHSAEIFLVDLLSPNEISAIIPKVVARVCTVLRTDDPRRLQIDKLPVMPSGPARNATLQQAMDLAYDASDQLHVRVRDFRNVILLSAFLIALLVGSLVGIVALNPSAMPLCFTPSATTSAVTESPGTQSSAGAGGHACPGGDHQSPTGGDVTIIAGLGLLGGALAAAFAIRRLRGTSMPYHVPIALALLKVPSGSLTAVAGILLLGSGFVPGLSQLDSQRQILAYALIFGYAQQLATRFIDHRAQTLLDSIPSKDPEAKQPTPSPQPLTSPPPAEENSVPRPRQVS